HAETECGDRRGPDRWHRAAVPAHVALQRQDVLAVVVRRVRADADLGRQAGELVLAGTDERAADVERDAAWAIASPHAATDAVSGFEHDDGLSRGVQPAGGGEPRVAGTDN